MNQYTDNMNCARCVQYTLYFMCDSYIGCDQEYEFKVKVAEESDDEEDDEDEESEEEDDAAGRAKRKREGFRLPALSDLDCRL